MREAKVEMSAVFPYTERTQKLLEILSFEGLLVIYKKVTLLPSAASKQRSDKIVREGRLDAAK